METKTEPKAPRTIFEDQSENILFLFVLLSGKTTISRIKSSLKTNLCRFEKYFLQPFFDHISPFGIRLFYKKRLLSQPDRACG